MSARFRRMAARLWPDSLFGRLAMILFSGLVAAHVLAFVLIVLDRFAIEDELGNKFAAVDIADAVAILDYVKPEERPAWLDRLSRLHYRYVLRDGGELEAETPKRRSAFAGPAGARPRREFCLLRSTGAIATGHPHASAGR
jgi:hypothetical protein